MQRQLGVGYIRRRDRWLAWLKRLSKRWLLPLPFGRLWHELLIFGVLQAWACLFAGVLLGFILLTKLSYPGWMPVARYDFLLLVAILTQVALLAFKFERIDEAKVILIFHIVATVMELFKTAKGSWVYPDANVIRIAGVPLFSGFLYSAVGSYIARCWRLFDFRFSNYPDVRWTWALALLIYVNFFTHHYMIDLRYLLFAAGGSHLWSHRHPLHRGSRAAPHAASARLLPRLSLHLDRRERRLLFHRLAVPPSAQSVVARDIGQARLVVSADDHQLCPRVGRQSTETTGAAAHGEGAR